MAVVKKPAPKTTGKAPEAPAKKAPGFAKEMDMKFGIGDLANLLDLDETYTRAKLRSLGVEKKAKGGSAYGWNSKADMEELVKKLNAKAAPKAAPKPVVKPTGKDAGKAKAASAQTKPTGMPKGTDKDKAAAPLKKDVKAPNDKAIDKSAKDAKAGAKKLGK